MSERDYIEKFLEENRSIQEEFLNFLEDEANIEENLKKLNLFFEEIKIRDCKQEFRLFLHMILEISNNHHRGPNFFSKIEQILQLFKDDIKKYFSNSEIFILFNSNKRILLYLIEEEILNVDKYFAKQVTNKNYSQKKYPQYFAPEIKQFMNEKWFPKCDPDTMKNMFVEEIKKELPDDFYEKRKKGENDSYLCKLIQKDEVQEFITYVNKNNILLDAEIEQSIYETNSFLLEKYIQSENGITLIEYAAFCGSFKIFNYFVSEKVTIKPSVFINAIHSQNIKLIHLLEEKIFEQTITVVKNHKKVEEQIYKVCFEESIKCHHNDAAFYFLDHYLQKEDENSNDTIIQSLKYYNFSLLQNAHINETFFCYLCHYDYYEIVKVILAISDVDINSNIILIHIFQLHSKSYFLITFIIYLSMTFKIISFNYI